MTAMAQSLQVRAKRIHIMLLFASLGPAVGTFAMLAAFMSHDAFRGNAFLVWLGFAPLALLLGYIYGSAPAALAGVAYALVPRGLQRITLSPLMGATVVAVFFAALGQLFALDPSRDLVMYSLLSFSGAVAALVCAGIARAMQWDVRSVGA